MFFLPFLPCRTKRLNSLIYFACLYHSQILVSIRCHLTQWKNVDIGGIYLTLGISWTLPLWSFKRTLPLPLTFIFNFFSTLIQPKSPSFYKIVNMAWSLHVCMSAIESSTHLEWFSIESLSTLSTWYRSPSFESLAMWTFPLSCFRFKSVLDTETRCAFSLCSSGTLHH